MFLELKNIVKSYGPVLANRDVSFSLGEGEILALVGENGAGKSTIMKILYGLEKADSGEIFLRGKKMNFRSPTDAMRNGIGMVQQHFMLFPSMTVAENIVYNREIRRSGVFMNKKKTRALVQELSERYRLGVDPDRIVGEYPVGLQQRVEILKILYQNTDIIIFDEPSAVLTPLEVKDLMATIRVLAAAGKSIILITHKLQEVMDVADRVVVMRSGQVVGTRLKRETNAEELSFMMVGRLIPPKEIPAPSILGDLLTVRNLCLRGPEKPLLDHVNLHVQAGEIVGVAGVSGNGQSELVRCLFGLTRISSGEILLGQKSIANRPVGEIRAAGLALIPEDRYSTGSAREASLQENILIGSEQSAAFSHRGVLRWKEISRHADRMLEQYDIRASSSRQAIGELSGGNAQKLIVAREISRETPMLIASEPTRGVDIGAIEFIHDKLLEKRAAGGGVLLVSSELSEIMKLCDRIYVIHNGRIVGEFARGKVDEIELGLLMLGGKANAG